MIETAGEELPAEPKLQRRFAEYIEWGTGVAREASQPGYVAPPVEPVPRWDWGPAGPPGGAARRAESPPSSPFRGTPPGPATG